MAGRHLRDLLSEEQEPFALQSFIDERRCRRRHSKFRDSSHLLSGSQSPAVILIETASRVHKLGKKNRLFFQKRKKKKCSIDNAASRSLGQNFLASLFKRLLQRKQRFREIRHRDEEALREEEQKRKEEEDLQRATVHLREEEDLQRATVPLREEKVCAEKEEQHSPVSVLDPPPFDGEDDAHCEEQEEEDGDEASSFHKAKQKLLSRLSRFESLADLDPLQLDWRLAEDEIEDDDAGKPAPLKSADICPEKLGLQRGIKETLEMDLRQQEGDEWRRFPDQVAEIAAVFSVLLASELAEDFVQTLHVD